MSENQSSKPAPDSKYRTVQDSRIDDVDTPSENSAGQMTTEPILTKATAAETEAVVSQAADGSKSDWESAPLPGTVDIASVAKIDSIRENELLTLIHDLNDCNDVLLSRVSQLETALDESQRRLQQAGEQSRAATGKMAEQLSAEQLSAQQISQNAQQQVANVVAQLETAEQSLQRQQLINETLQSELNNAQERVSQLEHECALGAQQHAAEAQARVQAETTIRDLRSRLQRQQRYTLQFKAALEKSLTVTTRSAAASVQGSAYQGSTYQGNTHHRAPSATARPTSFSEPAATQTSAGSGVTMPKAQRIMPWAGAITSPFEGIDPHLESLIRGASTPKQSSAPLDTGFEPSVLGPRAEDSSPEGTDAEDKLWQDMERVIENSTDATAPDSGLEVPSENLIEAPTTESFAESTVHTADDTTEPSLEVPALKGTAEGTAEETAVDAATRENDKVAADTPKLNWQRKVVPTDAQSIDAESADAKSVDVKSVDAESVDAEPVDVQPVESVLTSDGSTVSVAKEASVEKEPLIQALGQKVPSDRAVVIDPYTVPVGQMPAAEVAFTEPSPWGKPLTEKAAVQATAAQAASSDAESATSQYLPAFDGEASAVAPTANPLRTQKKIGSMSAVQLPTFEKAKAGSFKR